MKFSRAGVAAAAVCALAAVSASAQPLRFDDVIRNLRNPDPKARLSAIELLRNAKYPEAIGPIAPLVVDPVDDVQLEAIAAELSFFVDQDLKPRHMVGFVIERRNPAVGTTAFDLGPLAVIPRTPPPDLVSSLLKAVDDENPSVRIDAIYAVGVITKPPLTADQSAQLIKALDHFDPAIRSAAAEVIGRLRVTAAADALIKAVNDSHADVRYSAMRALGAIHEPRAIGALTEQFAFYRKGEGAASALQGLADIGSVASVAVFKAHLDDKDPNLRRAAIEGLGRAGDSSQVDTIERLVTADDSAMVRAASEFAMQKLGHDYVSRLVDALYDEKVTAQAQAYLMELGRSTLPAVVPRLRDPDPGVRQAVAEVLGALGDDSTIPALQAAAQDSNASVAAAAKTAMEKIQLRG
ncbi:MAG: HEAT repeat domain-containing protein [Vicinamibacterales bacterium]